MTKLKDLKARFMEDPEFREEYARIDEEYALVEALVRARTAANLRVSLFFVSLFSRSLRRCPPVERLDTQSGLPSSGRGITLIATVRRSLIKWHEEW